MSQVLGAFGLLDFTMLRPDLAWRTFSNLWTVYFSNFQILLRAAVNRGYRISWYGGTSVCKIPHTSIRNSCARHSRSSTEEVFRRQDCERFSIRTLANETLRSSKTFIKHQQNYTASRLRRELSRASSVYAILRVVSLVTGRNCTVGTTSAKSSIHRKCRKRVFTISSLLFANAASCCEDVALKTWWLFKMLP
jgi:hypothetical protein